MQISCIEKHLGAFLSPFSTLHSSPPFSSLCLVCQIQLSTFIFPHFSSPLFSSLVPPIFHFLPSHPLQCLIFISLSPLLLPSPCFHSSLVSLRQRSRFLSLCFLSASLSLSVRAVFYCLFSFHSNDNEEIYMKPFSVAVSSGGGFNWRLYI